MIAGALLDFEVNHRSLSTLSGIMPISLLLIGSPMCSMCPSVRSSVMLFVVNFRAQYFMHSLALMQKASAQACLVSCHALMEIPMGSIFPCMRRH